ncbi:Uncharacterised protein [Vibrio cholerae]|uniref:Uncharacterized protein n=1 Tax=Vibrio cholerae TaxID=666 RepID=A0A655VZF2_VIBCL|nr:Uncharacterised protein [Vibrio cholerae]
MFWLNVEFGKLLNTAARAELRPSANTPPLMRFIYTGPFTGSSDTSEVAVISPIASSAVIRKISTRGINSDQSNPKPYCIGIGSAMS